MNRKRTLFQQLLIMTVVPVIIVFFVVIVTVNGILQLSVTNHTRETVRLTAAQISEQASIRVESLQALQEHISLNMSKISFRQSTAERQTDELLENMLDISPDVYCSWYIIEPGNFPGDKRKTGEMVRTPSGEIEEIYTYTDEVLDEAAWYQKPLKDGKVYFDTLDLYDFGQGEGEIYILSIVTPVVKSGKIIGCVGMDVRYETLLRLDGFVIGDIPQKIMLVSEDSTVLFSFDNHDIGKKLGDYDFLDKNPLYSSLEKKNV